jgi:hypothetical protein
MQCSAARRGSGYSVEWLGESKYVYGQADNDSEQDDGLRRAEQSRAEQSRAEQIGCVLGRGYGGIKMASTDAS